MDGSGLDPRPRRHLDIKSSKQVSKKERQSFDKTNTELRRKSLSENIPAREAARRAMEAAAAAEILSYIGIFSGV